MVITLPFTTLRTFRAQPSIRPSPCRGIAETQPLVSLPTVHGRNPSHQTVSLQYRGGTPAIRQSPYSTRAKTQPSDSLPTVQGRKPSHQSPYSTGAETQPSVSLQYRGGNPAISLPTVQGRKPSHQAVACCLETGTQPSGNCWAVSGQKPSQ